MNHIPNVVNQLPSVKNQKSSIQFCPKSVCLTSSELLLLNPRLQYISVHSIDPFQETYRIFIKNEDVEAIWYMACNDSILLQEKDQKTNKIKFELLINWRSKSKSKGDHNCVFLPDEITCPKKWSFRKPKEDEFHVLLLGSFDADSNPTAQIHENSIIILSEAVALIWDIYEKPIFRIMLLLPLPVKRPSFSFFGDLLAIVINNNLFILKITNEKQVQESNPYIPGTKCFELVENELVIDIGISQENNNFLFLERHLPEREVSVKIVFQLRPPSETIDVNFISKDTLIILTNDTVLCCKHRTVNGKEIFDPAVLMNLENITNVLYNSSFLILYNKTNIDFLPNPNKSKLDLTFSELTNCDQVKMLNIKFVCVNENYCVVITTYEDSIPNLYLLKFEDTEKIINVAINSPNLDAKRIGLYLMKESHPLFATATYSLATQLINTWKKDKKRRNSTALEAGSLFSYSFNTGKLNQKQRKDALSIIMDLQPSSRRVFFERALLKKEEITNEILKDILKFPPSVAVIKLLQAQKFDCDIKLSDSPESDLFKAIHSSIQNEHEKAKTLFSKLPDNFISLINDDLLSKISNDLSPITLIKIGKPELPNNEWELNERKAAYCFYNNKIKESIQIASFSIGSKWHFNQWPKVPCLCDWVEGDEILQFFACCVSEYDITEENIPKMFESIIKGINFAKSKQYQLALDVLGDNIYPLKFLREFAKEPKDLVIAVQQLKDFEIKEAAFHFLISNSPKSDYYTAVNSYSSSSEFNNIFNQLKDADNKLIGLISLSAN